MDDKGYILTKIDYKFMQVITNDNMCSVRLANEQKTKNLLNITKNIEFRVIWYKAWRHDKSRASTKHKSMPQNSQKPIDKNRHQKYGANVSRLISVVQNQLRNENYLQ